MSLKRGLAISPASVIVRRDPTRRGLDRVGPGAAKRRILSGDPQHKHPRRLARFGHQRHRVPVALFYPDGPPARSGRCSTAANIVAPRRERAHVGQDPPHDAPGGAGSNASAVRRVRRRQTRSDERGRNSSARCRRRAQPRPPHGPPPAPARPTPVPAVRGCGRAGENRQAVQRRSALRRTERRPTSASTRDRSSTELASRTRTPAVVRRMCTRRRSRLSRRRATKPLALETIDGERDRAGRHAHVPGEIVHAGRAGSRRGDRGCSPGGG